MSITVKDAGGTSREIATVDDLLEVVATAEGQAAALAAAETLNARVPATLTESGNLKVALVESAAPQAVTGSFYPETQPVSGAFWPETQPVSGDFYPEIQPVSAAALPLPEGAATETTLATRLSESGFDSKIGSLTETPPGTDTASSGLNGRLQRLAQLFTSMLGRLPASVGQKAKAASLPVTLASDEDLLPVLGGVTETAPGTDTASSGLNGRLQRVAQRITALIALLPAALGQGTMAQSLRVVLPSDQTPLPQVGQGDVLDVTLSLDTNAYGDGDVLADTQAVTGAFRAAGGRAFLKNIIVLDEDDQGQGLDLIFLDANHSIGTENSAPSVTDANARTIIGRLQIPSGAFYDLGGSRIAFIDAGMIMLKAAAASTTLYVAAISRGTGTYTASGIRLKLALVWD